MLLCQSLLCLAEWAGVLLINVPEIHCTLFIAPSPLIKDTFPSCAVIDIQCRNMKLGEHVKLLHVYNWCKCEWLQYCIVSAILV